MGASPSKITSKDKAILDLKVQRDQLKQYSKKIQLVVEKEVDVARKQLQAGNKRGALIALKKKRYQEQLLAKTDEQLLNLEQLTQAIEYALVEQKLLKGLETGTQVLKSIHQEMSLENVEKLMDDTADAIAYQNEIDARISENLSTEDLEAIVAELDTLIEAEEKQKDMQLPQIPMGDVVDQQTKEKDGPLEFPAIPSGSPAVKPTKREKEPLLA